APSGGAPVAHNGRHPRRRRARRPPLRPPRGPLPRALPLPLRHPAPPFLRTIAIAEARSLPLGTVVTIDGSVTVPSGACASSAAPLDQGFAIQDRTGGIFVSVDEDLGFAPRRQVRVTGQLADDGFGLLVLIGVTAIKPHG